MNVIKTTALTKYYGTSRGIIDVDLTVAKGDFFGFIGPNGAGKSTTIRALLGLISPTSGKAEIFGKDIQKDKTEILSKVGYLPSEMGFYGNMRVKEMLSLSANLRKQNCEAEAKILCERLDLDAEKRIGELSLGNRKKVGIICALQHKPELYILDEPTSGLDPLMQREFYTIMQERNAEGATVFLSSHVLSEVSRYCNHAAIIREGRLLVTDSVANLGNTGVKRISLRGVKNTPALTDVKDMKKENDNISFLYGGKAEALIKTLAQASFEDISITDPDLDEVFMHYYVKEESK